MNYVHTYRLFGRRPIADEHKEARFRDVAHPWNVDHRSGSGCQCGARTPVPLMVPGPCRTDTLMPRRQLRELEEAFSTLAREDAEAEKVAYALATMFSR
jgi:hypothetical protein